MILGPTRYGVTKALPGEHTVEKEPAYVDDAISSQPSQAVRGKSFPGTEAARHGTALKAGDAYQTRTDWHLQLPGLLTESMAGAS